MNRGMLAMAAVAGLAGSSVLAGPPGSGGGGASKRIAPGAGVDVFPFNDDFEAYAPGPFPCAVAAPACPGPNGWSLWYAGSAVGPQLGQIVTGAAHSGTKMLKLLTETDITQTGLQTSGRWVVKAQTYAASSMTGTAYFIVMTRYNSVPAAGAETWAIEIDFHGDGLNGNNVRNAWQGANQVTPLIRDQWVEIRAEIDLDANTFDIYYGGTLLVDNQMYAFGGVTPALVCLDLYASTIGGDFFYDTVVVEPMAGGCYPNCDNSTTSPVLNVQDFTCFLQRYAAGDTYANCDNSTTAPTLNVQDFTCFLQSYAAGCP
jgi:hypothetical protein